MTAAFDKNTMEPLLPYRQNNILTLHTDFQLFGSSRNPAV